MMKPSGSKKKYWRNLFYLWIFLFVYSLVIVYGIAKITGEKTVYFTIFLIYLILVTLSYYYYLRKPKYKELQEFFVEFNYKAEKEIFDTFGEESFLKIYHEDLVNRINIDGIEIFTDLIKQSENSGNTILNYVLLVKLGEYYAQDGQYEKSIECLDQSLMIKPKDFIANFLIARNHERLNNAEEAITFYKVLLDNTSELTEDVIKFIQDQIKRIEENGPHYAPPIPGLQFLP